MFMSNAIITDSGLQLQDAVQRGLVLPALYNNNHRSMRQVIRSQGQPALNYADDDDDDDDDRAKVATGKLS